MGRRIHELRRTRKWNISQTPATKEASSYSLCCHSNFWWFLVAASRRFLSVVEGNKKNLRNEFWKCDDETINAKRVERVNAVNVFLSVRGMNWKLQVWWSHYLSFAGKIKIPKSIHQATMLKKSFELWKEIEKSRVKTSIYLAIIDNIFSRSADVAILILFSGISAEFSFAMLKENYFQLSLPLHCSIWFFPSLPFNVISTQKKVVKADKEISI